MLRFALTRDGVRVAYETTGRGAPLVLVHGLGDDRSIWQEIVARLAPHYTCVTLDLRGHGQTTGAARYEPLALAHDLEAVIAEAALRQPALIGHSLGAFVATMYGAAARHPVRAVLNVDQPLALAGFGAIVKQHEAALRAGRVREVYFELLGTHGLGALSDAQRDSLERARDRLPPEVILGLWGPFFEPQFDALIEQVERALSRIAAPYLYLLGHDAEPDYVGWLRERVPQVEIESWSGHGHFLHLVEPDRFADRVRRFVG